jgi:hypothetical protein
MLLGTFILPLVGAIPIALLGKTPLDYTTSGTVRVAIAAAVLGSIAVAVGLWWFGRKWLLHAALFFVPFVVLYSTFFTSPQGLVGGLVGLLSYWTVQQDVARGGQPLYYYAFLLILVYEFLPALGTLAAALIASKKKLWQSQSGQPFKTFTLAGIPEGNGTPPPVPVAALLVYWSVSSLALFTYAGEKMPWLTIHIALPMILAAAWAFGWMVETVPWGKLAAWNARNYVRGTALTFFGLLALLTARTAFKAAYINYDYPFEFLVYAHGAPYPKALFTQIEELSLRTTGGPDMVVAYDNFVRYPIGGICVVIPTRSILTSILPGTCAMRWSLPPGMIRFRNSTQSWQEITSNPITCACGGRPWTTGVLSGVPLTRNAVQLWQHRQHTARK